ncbi:MAG: FkbM family methyltransferase [Myxococcota bacterium]
MTYYSQNGEDAILHRLFPDHRGTFIEVGCIDGKRFSNTLFFEQRGWTGLCIEAHPDYIGLLRENRPGSAVVHAAVGESDVDSVDFFANSRGTLSSLEASREAEFRARYGRYFTGFETVQVPMRTLSSLFDEHRIAHIDILSVDIEGTEVRAIRGLDLKRHRPTVIVVECDRREHASELQTRLSAAGYRFLIAVSNNLFFTRDPAHLGHLADLGRLAVELVHTQHPLDADGDSHESLEICFS